MMWPGWNQGVDLSQQGQPDERAIHRPLGPHASPGRARSVHGDNRVSEEALAFANHTVRGNYEVAAQLEGIIAQGAHYELVMIKSTRTTNGEKVSLSFSTQAVLNQYDRDTWVVIVRAYTRDRMVLAVAASPLPGHISHIEMDYLRSLIFNHAKDARSQSIQKSLMEKHLAYCAKKGDYTL